MTADLVPGSVTMRGLTLAQGSFFQAPEALEEDAGLAAMVFEQPFVVAAALAVIAVVAFLLFNRSEKGKLGALVAGGIVLAAAGVVAAGMAVETPRERVQSRTRALVEATGRTDASTVALVLDDEVDLLMGGQRVPGVGREVILGTIERLEGRFALEEASAITLQAAIDGETRARTQVQVRAKPEGGAPSLSWWLLNWAKDADGAWRVTRIDCLLFNGRRPSPGWMP